MREDEDATHALSRHQCDELVGSRVDLGRGFATGATVPVELPVGIGFADLARGQPLVRAVVDLSEQRGELWVWETGQLRGAPSPLQRA